MWYAFLNLQYKIRDTKSFPVNGMEFDFIE
ncbi:hypothetical protein LMG19282_01056 [Cupriavidus campinensis]|nr:hypothetical protein LMG19282_01056 [Cupriavidus campinensis]